MQQSKIDRLVDILSTPTYFAKEDQMVEKLSKILDDEKLSYMVDDVGNVYVTKGVSDYYPLVVAHTDTVHQICDFKVHFTKDNKNLYALTLDGKKTGIGGDDKAGVFVCLELLREMDVIKAIFLVGEEFGCYGARLAEPKFFENVGYALEFDAPCHNWVSYTSNGVRLFELDSEFINIIKPILEKYMDCQVDLGRHPYTDVSILKSNYDFSCINFSVGYYNMHSVDEYVDIDLCLNTVNIGAEVIRSLGNKKYTFIDGKLRERLDEGQIKSMKADFMRRKQKGI